TDDGDVWWEGMTQEPPAHLIDWLGKDWTPGCGRTAAHPNARFTAPARQCPVIDSTWEDPKGVPISAMLFGGRRPSTVPLVYESLSWQHGTFLGTIVSSQTTAAAAGAVGQLRHDPFAMLPFCGYNMADYFGHWLDMGQKTTPEKLPRIFYVNWFRRGKDNSFLWPGFGENSRVLKWIFERCDGEDNAETSPIGYLPKAGALDLSGLDVKQDALRELFHIDGAQWLEEVQKITKYYERFGDRLPKGIRQELANLERRLQQQEVMDRS
ncbi:MAG: phosphoenolpyruvate carboxykinase (GTP), partial [Chlamydiia bacterium]|nr:phosphoenolpyruvate carboxykinase (GTP) [Chlamydiia bacterium]